MTATCKANLDPGLFSIDTRGLSLFESYLIYETSYDDLYFVVVLALKSEIGLITLAIVFQDSQTESVNFSPRVL